MENKTVLIPTPSDALASHLLRELAALPPTADYWVALSGGMDSVVLLHLCVSLRQHLPGALCALHVNHKMQRDADHWQQFCMQLCHQWKIPLTVAEVRVETDDPQGEEAAARRARYRQFAQHFATINRASSPLPWLLQAHHLRDQAETVLFNSLRCARPHPIPHQRDLPQYRILRPLLTIEQTRIATYARTNQLRWCTDPSNAKLRYSRNYLRHRVLPPVRTRWPSSEAQLAKMGEVWRQQNQSLQEALKLLLVPWISANRLNFRPLLEWSSALRCAALRAFVEQAGFTPPSFAQIIQFERQLHVGDDRMPAIYFHGAVLRRFRNHVYIDPATPAIRPVNQTWNGTAVMALTEGFLCLNAVLVNVLAGMSEVVIRYRRGGEQLHDGKHTIALKTLMQRLAIPPWLRFRTPLIDVNGQLFAIANYWCHPALPALPLWKSSARGFSAQDIVH